jgi:hypothetical protein
MSYQYWAGNSEGLWMKYLEGHTSIAFLTKSQLPLSEQSPKASGGFFLPKDKAPFIAFGSPAAPSPVVLSQERWLRL